MTYLKEDGSLDIERINDLPFEEFMEEMDSLNEEQMNEYASKATINESKCPTTPTVVDIHELLAKGCVLGEDLFK